MGKVTLFLLCGFVAFLPFEMMAAFEDLPSGGKLLGMALVSSAIVAILTGHRLRMLSPPMVMRVVLVLFRRNVVGMVGGFPDHDVGFAARSPIAHIRPAHLGVRGHW